MKDLVFKEYENCVKKHAVACFPEDYLKELEKSESFVSLCTKLYYRSDFIKLLNILSMKAKKTSLEEFIEICSCHVFDLNNPDFICKLLNYDEVPAELYNFATYLVNNTALGKNYAEEGNIISFASFYYNIFEKPISHEDYPLICDQIGDLGMLYKTLPTTKLSLSMLHALNVKSFLAFIKEIHSIDKVTAIIQDASPEIINCINTSPTKIGKFYSIYSTDVEYTDESFSILMDNSISKYYELLNNICSCKGMCLVYNEKTKDLKLSSHLYDRRNTNIAANLKALSAAKKDDVLLSALESVFN